MSLPEDQTAFPSPGSASPGPGQRRRTLQRLVLVAAILLLILFLAFRPGAFRTFDLHSLVAQLRSVSALHVVLGLAWIYLGFCLRAVRWSVLLGKASTARWTRLLPSQLIGFTAVALFGRVADLSRPYLTARELGTPVATQIAVYSVERTFDLSAAAILFSLALAFAPSGLPHHEAFARAGLLSSLATLILAGLAITIRLRGDHVARWVLRIAGRRSPAFLQAAALRIEEFQAGFGTISSVPQFLATLTLSLLMWLAIALTYMQAARAFTRSPVLSAIGFTEIMLLMATSLGASALQLPLIGWFTQIAVLAAAYRGFFGVPLETASACSALTLLLTSLSVIPGGLLAARLKGLGLREAAVQSTP